MKFNQRTNTESAHSGPSKFLKLTDGQSIVGVFRGEIHSFYMKWVNGKSFTSSPDEPGAKVRFKLNFVTYENDVFVAKVFEFPQTVYNQLANKAEEFDLEKTKVRIMRKGIGTDTEYIFTALPKEPISPAMMKAIEETPLNILDGQQAPQAKPGPVKSKGLPGWDETDPGPDPDGLPF